jgi:ATP-dependent protease ClpP protease subunit
MPIVTKWGGSFKAQPLRERKGYTSFGSISHRKGSKKGKEDSESDKDKEEEAIDFMKLLSKKPKESGEDNFYTMDNNIYFQEEISLETISSLNRQIRELSTELLAFATKYDMTEPPPIKLHITSYGGSVVAAFSAIDCIESCKVPVHTIIDGYAASAATLISVCGAKRFIRKHASMLIHQVRSGMWGKMAEIEDDYANLQKTHEQIKKIYVEKTKLKKKDLANILKHDIDWDAETCLKNGLVDEII